MRNAQRRNVHINHEAKQKGFIGIFGARALEDTESNLCKSVVMYEDTLVKQRIR